jgi:hypothetical protein
MMLTSTAAGTAMMATAVAGRNKYGTTSTASISICLSVQTIAPKNGNED